MTAAAAKAAKAEAPKKEEPEVKPDPELEKANKKIEKLEAEVEKLKAELKEASEAQKADDGQVRDSETVFTELVERLHEDLEDGVAKSQVIIALESAKNRAVEVKVQQKAARDAAEALQA